MEKKLALRILFDGADRLSGNLKKMIGLGRSAGQEIGKLKREARDLDRQLAQVRGKMGAGGGGFMDGRLIMQERELAKAARAANAELAKRQRILQIDNQVAKMHGRGDALMASGPSNVIQGGAILAPFVLAAKGAMDFSSGMVDLQQKAELTNAEMVRMRGNILRAAKATHQLPEDMRSAVDVLAGFGMDARDAVGLAKPIGMLGTAFKVDLADGAAAAFANINNLKIGLNETGKAFDIMAAGGNAGAFEIKDMARWFPKLTAQAQALGQHGTAAVADLTAALQIARTGAGSADEPANNVSNLLQKINAPGTIRAFEKNFGVDLPAALKKAYAEGKTPLEAIAELTKKATGGDLSKLGFAFEDAQAQSAIRSLIQNMDEYTAMRAKIAKAEGTVKGAFSQRELNDGAVAWSAFKVQLSSTALTLGTKLLPVASKFLTIASGMIERVADFAQANPQLTTTLLYLVAGIGAAKIGLGALQFAFGGILKPMASAWGMFQKLRAVGALAGIFTTAAKAFGVLRVASLFLAKGVARAGMIMLANPLILAITAIVLVIAGAAYLIYRNWDRIKAAFNMGIAAMGQAWAWMKANYAKILPFFGPLGMVATFVFKNWNMIKGAFLAGVGMLGTAWGLIKEQFNAGVAFIEALPGKMFGFGKAIIRGIVNGITSLPGAVWNGLKSAVMTPVESFKSWVGAGPAKAPAKPRGRGIAGKRALGGPVAAGRSYLVGEKGPEIWQAPQSGRIMPNRTVASLARAAAASMALGAVPAAADSGMSSGAVTIGRIEIHQQPGEDSDELIRRLIAEIERRAAQGRRGAYRDE